MHPRTFFFPALTVSLLLGRLVQAQVIQSWTVNAENGSDPLLLTHNGQTLHVLQGLGPVFVAGTARTAAKAYNSGSETLSG